MNGVYTRACIRDYRGDGTEGVAEGFAVERRSRKLKRETLD